jgi:hypothetical protein
MQQVVCVVNQAAESSLGHVCGQTCVAVLQQPGTLTVVCDFTNPTDNPRHTYICFSF